MHLYMMSQNCIFKNMIGCNHVQEWKLHQKLGAKMIDCKGQLDAL